MSLNYGLGVHAFIDGGLGLLSLTWLLLPKSIDRHPGSPPRFLKGRH